MISPLLSVAKAMIRRMRLNKAPAGKSLLSTRPAAEG